jgi:diadenosine tetraphosphate (Ap4A) HIT family hydrolase
MAHSTHGVTLCDTHCWGDAQEMGLDGAAPGHPPDCAFCDPSSLSHILTETDHFRIVADYAPLVEGHTLIIPRNHYLCYGAVPVELEPELVSIKRRVARFFRARYRPAVFFEHGVFRQTVFHAHLHAFPFGPIDLRLFELAHPEGKPVRDLADLHAWYNEHGHYFYLEQPRQPERELEAAVFPPEEERYFQVLRTIREQTESIAGWQPAAMRRLRGASQIQALARAWTDFDGDPTADTTSSA